MLHPYALVARAAHVTRLALLGSFLLLRPGATAAQSLTVAGPTGSGLFGSTVTVLTNGNYVVTDPGYDNGTTLDVGAVYLYRGSDNVLLSTLTGTTTSDQVGSTGVVVLSNSNYLVRSALWNNGAVANVGAVTWGSGAAGTSGAVGAANSLVGTTTSDQVGNAGVTALSTGDYVVRSPDWDNGAVVDAGAITLGTAAGATTGAITGCNSVVGSVASQGNTLVFAYNATSDKLLVGLNMENKVVVGVGNPPAPTGAATQPVAGGATVANLVATGTAIQWYAAASGGPALAGTTPLANGTAYYATQTVGGCESAARLAVTALVPPGNALAFDGVDDHVRLPSGLNTAAFTFEAWVNYQDNGAWTRIFDFGTTANNWMLLGPKAGLGYTTGSVGNLFFSLKKNGASDETIFTSTPMPTGRWHHLAVTLATAGALTSGTIYLDGVAIGTNPAMALNPTALGTLTYSWLGRSANSDPYLKASLDEVRVWNTARTAAEVRADMAAPAAAPFPAALAFYLNMDQGTPATASTGDNTGLTTLYDLTAAAPATLTNFALASGAINSNYVQSYALVVPVATVSTARSATGFTANWTAPAVGTATSYLLDVSTTPDFAAPIPGSPFATTATGYTLTGLPSTSPYYYRVRALNSTLATPDQGAFSNVIGQATPLPVELTAFTATATGDAVRLAWATASEKNSQAFEVERSLSGSSFVRIGTVAAAGSGSSIRSYELLDAQLPAGAATLYYRLKQVDLDGTFSYSPVRTLALRGVAAGLSLYPNPVHGHATTLRGAQPGLAVTVFDALGRPVTAATADAAGTATLALPAGLPTGVYVVRAGSQALRLAVE